MPIIPKDFPTQTDIVSNIALTFITFSVGGTLLFKKIKERGKGIIWITVCEAEFAFLIVPPVYVLGSHVINIPGGTFIATFVPISLLLAALASPTDPSATLAVTHEYGADGEVARTIMG
jgi:NhaP-type Na+/H+ or K+/H+ antiporter